MAESTAQAMSALRPRWTAAARHRVITPLFMLEWPATVAEKGRAACAARPWCSSANAYQRQTAGRYFCLIVVPAFVASQNHCAIAGACAAPATVAHVPAVGQPGLYMNSAEPAPPSWASRPPEASTSIWPGVGIFGAAEFAVPSVEQPDAVISAGR